MVVVVLLTQCFVVEIMDPDAPTAIVAKGTGILANWGVRGVNLHSMPRCFGPTAVFGPFSLNEAGSERWLMLMLQ